MTFICYIGIDFTFGLLDCACYNEDFVISRFAISRFCSIHFTAVTGQAEEYCLLNRGLHFVEVR